MASLRPGLLIDRDGVINEECHYLHDPKDLVVIAGVAEAIAAINRRGIPVAVISNQAGIGRGMYGVEAYQSVNRAIETILARSKAHIDAWYFCPHLPDAGCSCRKPKAGMVLDAARDLALDLGRSVLVGDKESDLEAARVAGCHACLVRTGYGREVEAEFRSTNRLDLVDQISDSLFDALPFLERTFATPSVSAVRGCS